jgi:hypothetical protein
MENNNALKENLLLIFFVSMKNLVLTTGVGERDSI